MLSLCLFCDQIILFVRFMAINNHGTLMNIKGPSLLSLFLMLIFFSFYYGQIRKVKLDSNVNEPVTLVKKSSQLKLLIRKFCSCDAGRKPFSHENLHPR